MLTTIMNLIRGEVGEVDEAAAELIRHTVELDTPRAERRLRQLESGHGTGGEQAAAALRTLRAESIRALATRRPTRANRRLLHDALIATRDLPSSLRADVLGADLVHEAKQHLGLLDPGHPTRLRERLQSHVGMQD